MTVHHLDDPPSYTEAPPPDDHDTDVEPADIAAERAVLGAMLADETGCTVDAVTTGTSAIAPDDCYLHRHRAIFRAITRVRGRSEPLSPISVWAQLSTQTGRDGPRGVDAAYLFALMGAAPTPTSATWYAQRVRDQARLRELRATGIRLVELAGRATPDLIDDTLDEARRVVETAAEDVRAAQIFRHVRDVDEFLAAPDDAEYDWLIPGLLERGDRLMLTGPEGGGKSTFMRQVSVMCAAGLHPFTGELFPNPPRVLILDLENSERQSRRKLRPLRAKAGDLLDPERLRVEVRPSGIDLLTREDQDYLHQLVAAAQPDILVTGPIYRMGSGDPNEERTAKTVAAALDAVRASGCAVLLETHTPHAASGQRKRPTRPYGASLWLRWPEFGLFLDKDGTIEHWRGARDEREFPTLLKRGGEWPWTPEHDPDAVKWARVRQARAQWGEKMTIEDVAQATGMSRSAAGRLLNAHRDEWLTLNAEGYDD